MLPQTNSQLGKVLPYCMVIVIPLLAMITSLPLVDLTWMGLERSIPIAMPAWHFPDTLVPSILGTMLGALITYEGIPLVAGTLASFAANLVFPVASNRRRAMLVAILLVTFVFVVHLVIAFYAFMTTSPYGYTDATPPSIDLGLVFAFSSGLSLIVVGLPIFAFSSWLGAWGKRRMSDPARMQSK